MSSLGLHSFSLFNGIFAQKVDIGRFFNFKYGIFKYARISTLFVPFLGDIRNIYFSDTLAKKNELLFSSYWRLLSSLQGSLVSLTNILGIFSRDISMTHEIYYTNKIL